MFETTGHTGAEEWKRDTAGSNAKWVTAQTVQMNPRLSAPVKQQPTVAQLLSDPIVRSKMEAEALEQAQRDSLLEDERPQLMGADAIAELLKNPGLPDAEKARATKLLALMGMGPPTIRDPPEDTFDPPADIPETEEDKEKRFLFEKLSRLKDAREARKAGLEIQRKKREANAAEAASKDAKEAEAQTKLTSLLKVARERKARKEAAAKAAEVKEAEGQKKLDNVMRERLVKESPASKISRVAREKSSEASTSDSAPPKPSAAAAKGKPFVPFDPPEEVKVALYNSLEGIRDLVKKASEGKTSTNGGLSYEALISMLNMPPGTSRKGAESYAKKVLAIGDDPRLKEP